MRSDQENQTTTATQEPPAATVNPAKPRRGRPPGSKNKPKPAGVAPKGKTGPRPYSVILGELKSIEKALESEYVRFGLSASSLHNKSVSDRVKLILGATMQVLDRVQRLGSTAAVKHGVEWSREADMVSNFQTLLAALHGKGQSTKVPAANGATDAELHRLATLLNELSEYRLEKLPERGTEAIKIVMPLVEQQVQRAVK